MTIAGRQFSQSIPMFRSVPTHMAAVVYLALRVNALELEEDGL